jgi:hypothetical protein
LICAWVKNGQQNTKKNNLRIAAVFHLNNS